MVLQLLLWEFTAWLNCCSRALVYKGCRAGGGGHGYEASGDVEAPLGPGMLGLYCRFQEERSKKICDNRFPIDLGYFDHFCGTKFVLGGSKLDRFLLELEDWITACLREVQTWKM